MARIRSIKPEFFKHLDLQELENSHPGQNIMLVYAGLWTQCDKNGVFYCNAKVLKNEILPYLDFDMQETLDILEKQGYFVKYYFKNREYGFIPNFAKYQFCSANEKKCPAKYPLPPESASENVPETVPSTSQDVPEHVQEQYEDVPSNDTEHHTEPEGLQDKGLQEYRKKDSSGSDKPPKNGSFAILDREPKNDKERVEKQWLINYRDLYGALPVNPAWSITAPRIKKAVDQIGVEKVLQALETAKKDELCLKSGYILKTIMASNVISKLINARQGSPPKRIASDNIPPDKSHEFFREE